MYIDCRHAYDDRTEEKTSLEDVQNRYCKFGLSW
jgi:hypothetical protein